MSALQSHKSDAQETPLVLLWGASELRRELEARGLVCRGVRGLRQLLQPKEGLEARAIVLAEHVLEGLAISDVVTDLRRVWPLVDVVAWCRRPKASFVRNALRAGARDVIMADSPKAAARAVHEVLESQRLLPRAARLGDAGANPTTFERMVSRSPRMWDVFDTASRIATTDATVLILGETGTGKELMARAIHRRSQRPGRFVAVNCGAVQGALVDSELFGHVKGSFTGAVTDKAGLFRHADGGTLMLDEIGDLPLQAQYHLLRVLQEGTVRPVGGHTEEPVDVRVIAATSTSLEEDVLRGRFREDLFYRLDVIRLEIPPLRERREDIIYLFGHFAREVAAQYNVERPDVSDDFLDALVEYGWPGNVRQLENFTERFVLTRTGTRATAEQFARLLPFKNTRERSRSGEVSVPPPAGDDVDTSLPLQDALEPHLLRLERRYLEDCLRGASGKVGLAAEHAGISRRTLLRKLKSHGIDKKLFRKPADDAAT